MNGSLFFTKLIKRGDMQKVVQYAKSRGETDQKIKELYI